MDNNWTSDAYASGSYLHRLYLSKNNLVNGLHQSSDLSIVTEELNKNYSALVAKEDALLSAYARQFGRGTTAADGEALIIELLTGADKGLKGIIDSIKDLFKEGEMFDFEDKDNRGLVENAITDYIESIMPTDELNMTSDKISKLYEQLHSQMIEGINNITSGDKMSYGTYAIEGFIHEQLVTNIYIYNILKAISQLGEGERKKFEEWCEETGYLASFVGDNNAKGAIGGRKESYDMTIKVKLDHGFEDIPVQLKAKVRSKQPEIQLVQRMQIDNLISKTVKEDVQKKAIKTALINQHYWGDSSYKKLVTETGKIRNYNPDGNLSSAHPTALERLDEAGTLDTLKPIIPVLQKAILYNLVTGVSSEIDTLLYVVTTSGGYSLIRSSKLLLYMMGLEEHIETTRATKTNKKITKTRGLKNFGISGKMKYKTKDMLESEPIMDNSINDLYGEPGNPTMNQREWWDKTQGVVNRVYSRMGVTIKLNYGDMK